MKAKVYWLGVVALACLIQSGCVATQVSPVDRRVTIAPDITGSIVITDIKMAKPNSDGYVLQANVVNNLGSIVKLKYRVVWLDSAGIEVPSTNAYWADLSISPRDIQGLRAVAPSQGAVDFRLHVKRDRVN